MKTLNLEQMEQVSAGGFWGGTACSALMGAWGVVLAYGTATAVITAGTTAALSAGYSLLTLGICGAVGYAEGI